MAIDPTANVLREVQAAVKRLDDLAGARKELADERHRGVLREMEIRSDYERQMAAKEAARLDALRGLDRSAVDRLAETTATMAVTLREGVESTARTLAAANEASKKELGDKIRLLENAMAAGSGKGAGLNAAWIYLAGLVALLGTLYGMGVFKH